jgi:hypothetical protein
MIYIKNILRIFSWIALSFEFDSTNILYWQNEASIIMPSFAGF